MSKEIVVLRHALKDQKTKLLSDEGRKTAVQRGKELGKFHMAVATSSMRAQETVQLMTGLSPIIDDRSGNFDMTEEEKDRLRHRDHPLGTAGVVFEHPTYRERAIESGLALLELISEIFSYLPPEARALIITHDIPILGAREIIYHQAKLESRTDPLKGFKINEELEMELI